MGASEQPTAVGQARPKAETMPGGKGESERGGGSGGRETELQSGPQPSRIPSKKSAVVRRDRDEEQRISTKGPCRRGAFLLKRPWLGKVPWEWHAAHAEAGLREDRTPKPGAEAPSFKFRRVLIVDDVPNSSLEGLAASTMTSAPDSFHGSGLASDRGWRERSVGVGGACKCH